MDSGVKNFKKVLFKRYKFKYFKRGFTLVELLAVIVILAIIMLIAIPAVLSTLTTAKRKGFAEYVDKIFITTQKQVMEEDINGNPVVGCRIFYIKTDLGLSNTGNYDGFVLVKNEGKEEMKYYITMHDDEYKIEAYLYNGELDVNNIERWSKNDELVDSKACLAAGCSSCSAYEELTGEDVCPIIPEVSDSTPGSFSGSGTLSDPYLIESIDDLVTLSNKTNDGSLGNNKYFKLTTDLSFDCDKSYVNKSLKRSLTSGDGFTPIGNNYDKKFISSFDGNSKKIYGLYIKALSKSYAGLFGVVGLDSNSYIVKDLSVLDVDINSTSSYTGAVIAYGSLYDKSVSINNLSTSGDITCNGYCGGVIGDIYANNGVTVDNCVNKTNVTGNGNVGGVVGRLDNAGGTNLTNYGKMVLNDNYSGGTVGQVYEYSGELKNIKNYGEVTCKGNTCGGTVGYANKTVFNYVYNYGNIKGISDRKSYFGGVFGDIAYLDDKFVSNVYNYGNVSGDYRYIGGVTGNLSYAGLYNAYNYGTVTHTDSNSTTLGGIVGYGNSSSTIKNAGNQGNISSNGYGKIGGVVGQTDGKVTNVYNYGNVSNEINNYDLYIGGIIGEGAASNSYSIGNVSTKNYNYGYAALATGYINGNSNMSNVYVVGDLTTNSSSSSNNKNVGTIFGNGSVSKDDKLKNFYAKAKITGFYSTGLFAGYNSFYTWNSYHTSVDNLYIDLYTDATDIDDNRTGATSDIYSNYYGSLGSSPNKKDFKLAQQYDFSQVNGMWFRDTLKFDDNWKFANGVYPKLYKVLPNGSTTSELLEGQKDIAIK